MTLTISRARLEVIAARETAGPRLKSAKNMVTDVILETTRNVYPDCKCEQLGLKAGLHVREITSMGTGCTRELGWVCPRLNLVRTKCGWPL